LPYDPLPLAARIRAAAVWCARRRFRSKAPIGAFVFSGKYSVSSPVASVYRRDWNGDEPDRQRADGVNSGTYKDIEKLEADLWEAADNLRANSKLTSSD
jgi:hypothetical protein